MFTLIQKRRWYFLISALLIIPGLVAMIYSTATLGAPLRLASTLPAARCSASFEQPVAVEDVRAVFTGARFA